MPMPMWALVTVTIERPGAREARGTTVPDWSKKAEREVPGCWVGNASTSSDPSDEGRAANMHLTLYAPPGTDVRRGDRVTYAGDRYAIDGEPLAFPSPLGGTDHIECALVDWE